MRYIDHGNGGGPEVLTLKEADRPGLKPGEVLIAVAFAGVNRPDVAQRQGVYPPPPGASPIIGLEVSGRIEAAAPDVTNPRVGDEVCALVPGGGYAEFCAVPAVHCLPLPAGLTLLEAAAIPENYFTVWSNVFERGALAAGQCFLVHGGSSGIGLTAIQLAKAFGAIVCTTVGSAAKAEAVARAGADLAINYRTQDFVAAVKERTGGKGVNVILDMVGGDYLARNLQSLALDGRLLQIASMQGSAATMELRLIIQRRLTLTGSALRPRSIADKAAIADALRKNVWPLLAAGKAKPWIYRVFPLAAAAEAHALMESSSHIGKIMLQVSAPA
jgi:putative PIG3 family NAD(P)H quinone oxidoreductase